MSLTSAEKTAIEDFIEFSTSEFGVDSTKAIHIALVLTGERDGCLFGGKNSDQTDTIESILKNANIPYKRDGNAIYVAKSNSHLSSYDPTNGPVETGKFFGYPQEAIDFYENNSDRVDQWEEFIETTKYKNGKWGDEAWLIEYVPVPTEDGINRALERQRAYEKTIQNLSIDFSETHNF